MYPAEFVRAATIREYTMTEFADSFLMTRLGVEGSVSSG